MRKQREKAIELWFEMWLRQKDLGIAELFAPDAVYIESWGPEYHGVDKIKHWFDEWNNRGTVKLWRIKGYLHGQARTMAEWRFRCEMNDGTVQEFDGISLVEWTDRGKIARLQEFGCHIQRYDPCAAGPEPRFQETQILWF